MVGENSLFFLRSLWKYRERMQNAVVQDVRQRYAGSVLGMSWAVLYPMLLLGFYSLVYLMILKIRPSSLSPEAYVLLVFSGLVPLLAANEALVAATGSLSLNRSLLLNTVFPAELIPLRAVLAAQFPSLLALGLTCVFALVLGRIGLQAFIMLPLLWLMLVMFVVGLGWVLSLVTLVARDVQQALGLILMVLTILSPFAYTPDMVPENLKLILYLNPFSYYVLCFQQVICYGEWPSLATFLTALLLSIGSFLFGMRVFMKTKYIFFDYA